MLKEHKKSFEILFRLLDILIIFISFCIAYHIRFGLEALISSEIRLQFKLFFFAYLLLWLFSSNRFGLYSSKRFIGFWEESLDLLKITSLCFVIATIPAFFLRQEPLSRLFLLYFWPIHTVSLILFRFSVRKFLKFIRLMGYNFRQVLIVGCNPRAETIAKKIKETPEYGLRLLGCLDCTENGNSSSCSYNFNLIGNLEDLERIFREKVVDEVIVTLPMKSFYSEIEKIISMCEHVGVEVKLPIDLFSQKIAKSTISNYHDVQMIDFYTSPKMNWKLMIKRMMDVIISSLLLVILAPIVLVVAILIIGTSKGPVHFSQQRIGYNGRLFTFLKFRTMLENAEEQKKDLAKLNEMDGPVFKIKNDPRVTKIGRFLRKTSIDELPQLFNVLKGDMSIVGPRPPIPNEVCEYNLQDRRRLSMRPGITCLWQVNGRNSIPFDRWMELDREYIDRWSLWLDIKILAKTIPAVFRGVGSS